MGLLVGVGALVSGCIVEQGNLIALFGLSAMITILGGTLGAVITSFNRRDALGMGPSSARYRSPRYAFRFLSTSRRNSQIRSVDST